MKPRPLIIVSRVSANKVERSGRGKVSYFRKRTNMKELKHVFFLKTNLFLALATGTQSDGKGFLFCGGGYVGVGDGLGVWGSRLVRRYSLCDGLWGYKNIRFFWAKWEEVGVFKFGTNL